MKKYLLILVLGLFFASTSFAYEKERYCTGLDILGKTDYYSAIYKSDYYSNHKEQFEDFVKEKYDDYFLTHPTCVSSDWKMEGDIKLSKKIGRQVILTGWKPIPFTTQAISDFHITVPSDNREVEICVRDYECEDGDEVRVSINNSTVFDDEIYNDWDCDTVKVDKGKNKIELYAINGSGRKGNCSYHDANTGEIRIKANNIQTQRWEHRGGKGSSSNIIVDIE